MAAGTMKNAVNVDGFAGLSEAEARARLEHDGPNEIPAQQKRGLFMLVLEVVREPMFLMLVAAGVLYLLMGEPTDALMLLGFVFVVMAITIVQERRTERALAVCGAGPFRRDAGSPLTAQDTCGLALGWQPH